MSKTNPDSGVYDPRTWEELIERARQRYQIGSNDNIEIDDYAKTSRSDDGTWVQAWVWVPKEVPKD